MCGPLVRWSLHIATTQGGLMLQPTILRSIRVDDPNDSQVQLLALTGWELRDVTFDPTQQNWVMTFVLCLTV